MPRVERNPARTILSTTALEIELGELDKHQESFPLRTGSKRGGCAVTGAWFCFPVRRMLFPASLFHVDLALHPGMDGTKVLECRTGFGRDGDIRGLSREHQ